MQIAGDCTGWDENYDCKQLCNGKCGVYENRPFICRLFGASPDFFSRCSVREAAGLPYPLTAEQGKLLIEMYLQLMLIAGVRSDAESVLAIREHAYRAGLIPRPAEGEPDMLMQAIQEAKDEEEANG
jgi:hypothetical protein